MSHKSPRWTNDLIELHGDLLEILRHNEYKSEIDAPRRGYYRGKVDAYRWCARWLRQILEKHGVEIRDRKMNGRKKP